MSFVTAAEAARDDGRRDDPPAGPGGGRPGLAPARESEEGEVRASEAPEPEARPAEPLPPGARVCVLRGFYEGLEIPVDREWLVLGRGRGADVVLAEPTLSRAHAAIGWEGEAGFYVQDLGSTNGTRLNGERCPRAPLADGDEIQIGKLRMRFRAAA